MFTLPLFSLLSIFLSPSHLSVPSYLNVLTTTFQVPRISVFLYHSPFFVKAELSSFLAGATFYGSRASITPFVLSFSCGHVKTEETCRRATRRSLGVRRIISAIKRKNFNVNEYDLYINIFLKICIESNIRLHEHNDRLVPKETSITQSFVFTRCLEISVRLIFLNFLNDKVKCSLAHLAFGPWCCK